MPLNSNQGQICTALTKDHKPSEDSEKKRIIAAGGQLYQNNQILHSGAPFSQALNTGPVRVLPGRLSVKFSCLKLCQVSRTFGDAHAKVEEHGGNPRVVVALPDITHFKLSESFQDFILIASDGVFDRLTNEEVVSLAWGFNERSHNNER